MTIYGASTGAVVGGALGLGFGALKGGLIGAVTFPVVQDLFCPYPSKK